MIRFDTRIYTWHDTTVHFVHLTLLVTLLQSAICAASVNVTNETTNAPAVSLASRNNVSQDNRDGNVSSFTTTRPTTVGESKLTVSENQTSSPTTGTIHETANNVSLGTPTPNITTTKTLINASVTVIGTTQEPDTSTDLALNESTTTPTTQTRQTSTDATDSNSTTALSSDRSTSAPTLFTNSTVLENVTTGARFTHSITEIGKDNIDDSEGSAVASDEDTNGYQVIEISLRNWNDTELCPNVSANGSLLWTVYENVTFSYTACHGLGGIIFKNANGSAVLDRGLGSVFMFTLYKRLGISEYFTAFLSEIHKYKYGIQDFL